MSWQANHRRAIVISDLGGGGSQHVVTRLATAWRNAGRDVTVITLAASATDDMPLPGGVQRIVLDRTGLSGNAISGVLANLRRITALRRAIRASGARQVVSFLAATNILTILACRGLGVTVVVSERNDPARQRLGFSWEILRRMLYRFADVVTANSRQAIVALRSYVPATSLVLVPNYLPDWQDEPPPAEARERIILAVGRLHDQKGYHRLLPMFAASSAPSRGWQLVVLGEGGKREAIEYLRDELGLSGSVVLPGYQSDVKSWYDRAAIFVMTSSYEGTANALLEAISRGLPAVVSRTSGDGPYYVERLACGLVIDSLNIGESAAAIDRLSEDLSLRKKFSAAGRSGLKQLMSANEISSLWEDVLTQASSGRNN